MKSDEMSVEHFEHFQSLLESRGLSGRSSPSHLWQWTALEDSIIWLSETGCNTWWRSRSPCCLDTWSSDTVSPRSSVSLSSPWSGSDRRSSLCCGSASLPCWCPWRRTGRVCCLSPCRHIWCSGCRTGRGGPQSGRWPGTPSPPPGSAELSCSPESARQPARQTRRWPGRSRSWSQEE